ncbi:hypothetical protein [Lactococcus garvieae]|uniref:hypothetical protein n=1 Tax=Lactococcus garvieae TaxID=1363 RepID=UPI002551C377|nr:hypothetical protein [Lactococcus garvieae]
MNETELLAYREERKRLEKNLKRTVNLAWEKFDHIDSARIPKALDLIRILHRDIYEEPYIPVKTLEGKLRIKRPTFHVNNGLNSFSIFYGKIKANKDKSETTASEEINVPRYLHIIMDYLAGTIAIDNDNFYLINGQELVLLSQMKLSERYRISNRSTFDIGAVEEFLLFIHEHLQLKPIKAIKKAVIACNDFQLDLHHRKILVDTAPKADECYFKRYDCNYREVMDTVATYGNYLEMVIDDKDSLHNASLQPIYTMLVACREGTKAKFFVSKSAERTGKGLRHKVISSPFVTKDVLLDNLGGGGFEALNAWAQLDGGEFLLATEQGDITGKAMERALKIISTEDTHQARQTGGNTSNINLTGVLSIDSNAKILLDEGMNSRAVNIAFRNRPAQESDNERENVFSEYWEAFTIQTATSTSRTAKISAGVASLVHSFMYWQSESFKFNFKIVEMNNLLDNSMLDDVQERILDIYTQGNPIIYFEHFPDIVPLLAETYQGAGKKDKRNKALEFIGFKQVNKTVLKNDSSGYTSKKAFVIRNQKRLTQISTAYLENKVRDNEL